MADTFVSTDDVASTVARLRLLRLPLVALLALLCVRMAHVNLADSSELSEPAVASESPAEPAEFAPPEPALAADPPPPAEPARVVAEAPAEPETPAAATSQPGSVRALTLAVAATMASRRDRIRRTIASHSSFWREAAGAVAQRAPTPAAAQVETVTDDPTPVVARSEPPAAALTVPDPAPAEPPVAAKKTSLVTIVNPAANGGDIHYLLGGSSHSLRPGQSQELPAERPWRISFHRGGPFGDAAYSLSSGSYQFHVTARGWELSRVP